ncbi:Creatinase [Artemisia annua]|uniref:Creatinase n=1 Tax=Artemisia annua TaxID=35608 RepID=A0A2U1KK61_ARTAN|nr:Creatinase [Artemisia annua]
MTKMEEQAIKIQFRQIQHLDGTTDITRNVHFRKPNEHERRCYTVRKNALLKDYKGSRKSSVFVDK